LCLWLFSGVVAIRPFSHDSSRVITLVESSLYNPAPDVLLVSWFG
jgi:hypothetical protein